MDNRILNISGWMMENELNWLWDTVKKMPENATILEIGAWKGRSTSALYLASSPAMKIVTVDTWLGQEDLRFDHHKDVLVGDIFLEFLENMKSLGIDPKWYNTKNIGCQYMRIESKDLPNIFEDRSIDMIFDDGDHRKVRENIINLVSKLKIGGIYAIHDWGSWVTDVEPELIKDFSDTQKNGTIWSGVK